MDHGHSHGGSIPNLQNAGGPFQISGGLKTLFIVFAVIGVAAFALGLQQDPARAWSSFLLNHFYFMSLALGGLFIATLHWLTMAMWSAPVRRISESFTAYLPVALILSVVLYFGMHDLFIWTHPEIVKGDAVLEHKEGWLN